MDKNAKPSLLDTKQADLTVGDSLKVDLVTAAIAAVTPILVTGAIKGSGAAWKKFQSMRTARKSATTTESE